MSNNNSKGVAGYNSLADFDNTSTRTNHLLVIAIDEYNHGIPDLNNAVRDAKAVADLLLAHYQFEEKNTQYLFNEKATRENIIKVFEQYCENLSKDDNLVFYYSGHGELYKTTKRGYWIPSDGKQGNRASWLSNSDIRDYLSSVPAHHVLGIVDSCFSGTLFNKNVASTSVPDQTISFLDSYPSRWLLTAGRETIVSDGEPGGHSPFAQTLLNQLEYNPASALNISALANQVLMSPALNRVNAKPLGKALDIPNSENGQFIFYKKDFVASENSSSDFQSHPAPNQDTRQVSNPVTTTLPASNQATSPPSFEQLVKQLKTLVSDAETEKALDLLDKKIKPDSQIGKDLPILQSRYNRLHKQQIRGLITESNYNMTLNQINYALLSYVEDLEEEDVNTV